MAKAEYGVIEGTIVYAKLAQADQKYQSKDFEYSIEVIVSEDVADEWDAKFKKQPAKKIRAADFEAKYKIQSRTNTKRKRIFTASSSRRMLRRMVSHSTLNIVLKCSLTQQTNGLTSLRLVLWQMAAMVRCLIV